MAEKRCDGCQHWRVLRAYAPKSGECRVRAPVVILRTRNTHDPVPGYDPDAVLSNTCWPITESDDWCGEHAPKESAP